MLDNGEGADLRVISIHARVEEKTMSKLPFLPIRILEVECAEGSTNVHANVKKGKI